MTSLARLALAALPSRLLFTLCAGFIAAAPPATAQDFSGKPIRMIVGLVAGGATDVMARLIAEKLGAALNTPVYVDNRPGALFIPAFRELAAAPPDGHTLFMISTSVLVTQPLHPDYPIDIRAMTPVTEVASGPLILVARKDLPIKSIAELIAYDHQHPGGLTFGSGGGTGSSMYLATELLKMKTGIKPVHIPYKGNAATLADLLGGHIDLMFDAMPVMAAQVKAGSVIPLIVTSAKRSPTLPDADRDGGRRAGFSGRRLVWIAGPADTPATSSSVCATKLPKQRPPRRGRAICSAGVVPVASEPDQWRDTIKSELDRWGKVIKDAGIKVE